MKSSPEIRLYGGPNLGGIWDVALDEALLRNTRENHGPLTFRFWQNVDPVLVLPRSTLPKEETLFKKCQEKGVHVTRGLRGRKSLLHGPGVLSFSVIDTSEVLTSGDLETEIGELLSPIVQGIQSEVLPNEITFGQDYILARESVVGVYNTHYYFDYLLLQGMVIVHNYDQFAELMISSDETQFSWPDGIKSDVSISPLIDSIVQSVSQYFGHQMSVISANTRETELMHELHKWKYTNDDWIFHQWEPLALGRVLLEAYLAYPPTTRCREIMTIIDDLSKTHSEKVECRTWLRGRGLVSWLRGVPPGLRPSGGVTQASKKNIVPAMIIEGKITHERTVPTYENLCRIIEKAYDVAFGGTSK